MNTKRMEKYSGKQITQEDVNRLNREELERVQDASNLFIAITEAAEGDLTNLNKQVYMKYSLKKGSLNGDIRFTNNRLNYLSKMMKNKYSGELNSFETFSIGNNRISGVVDNKAFSDTEIDNMLASFIMQFHTRFINLVDLEKNIDINVPSIHSFKKDEQEHSNNSLLKYIIGEDGKIGRFEVALIETMDNKADVTRYTENGITKKVKLNDLTEINFDDIVRPENETGEKLDVNELIADENVNVEKQAIEDDYRQHYFPTKEMDFISKNYKDILTANQLEKFNVIVEAIESKKVDVNDLFHPVTGELVTSRLGQILYPGAENSYLQPQTRSLLESMRNRMNKALEQQKFNENREVRSDYRRLKNHSMRDNKLFADYKIYDKYVIRDIRVDDFHKEMNVTFKNEEQFIPFSEIEKIERNEQTVSDVIKKYQLTKKAANNENGAVKHYVIDKKNGTALFTDEEIKEREDKHCRRLLEWIREGEITFTVDEINKDIMKPSSDKMNDITYEEYCSLVKRPIALIDDKKELEIVRNNVNWDKFNTVNSYKLVDSYYVDDQDNKYIYLKNYDLSDGVKEIAELEKII